ncbi:MAG: hypothetical protein KGI52_07410 [Burkholderiales bacterium]|nr:hypothetical protein [Burkholderiales bacterium]
MSLDRKDAKPRFDPDDHALIAVLAEIDGMTISEWIAVAAVEKMRGRVHDATVVAETLARLGTAGKSWEKLGAGGKPTSSSAA